MSAVPAAAAEPRAAQGGGTAVPESFVRRLRRRPIALVCIGYLLIVAGVAIFAPIALPKVGHEPYGGFDFCCLHQGPSWRHVLGTDGQGRDLMKRLIVGTRPAVFGAFAALVVATLVGVPIGLAGGFVGGRIDRGIGWLTDLALAFPGLIVVIVAATITPGSQLLAMAALGLVLAPGVARVVRAATLPVREELYVAAARVSGLSRLHILGREILPRISGVVIVQATLAAGTALVMQSGLVVIGLIAPPSENSLVPTLPTWGGLIADGITHLFDDPWLIWPPGFVLALTVIVLAVSGDIVRDLATETWAPKAHTARRTPIYRRPGQSSVALVATPAPAQAPSSLLAVEGLSIAFPTATGPLPVVEDVTFSIEEGQTVGLMGESGCGKTVTAMSILGLLPGGGRITSGSISFAGRNLAALSERGLRRVRGTEIGLISQDPMVAFTPVYRVGWQLAEVVRRHHSVSRAEARRRTIELLRRVHLPEPEVVAERLPHELSGGMAQRVALAAALAGEPKLLIADEPTTALDVTVQAEILELLRELQRDTGMAMLLITHDGGVIADICDHVVVMYAGQVVERGEAEELFGRPLHPYTHALLRSNPHRFVGVERLPAIPGTVPDPGHWPEGCRFHPRCSYATRECSEPIPLEQLGEGRESRCIHRDRLVADEV